MFSLAPSLHFQIIGYSIESAVYANRLSCDPTGFVADKQLKNIRNILWFAEPSERVHLAERIDQLR